MADILAVLRADTAQFSAAMLDAKAETSGGRLKARHHP
jgi:hypothetical protein